MPTVLKMTIYDPKEAVDKLYELMQPLLSQNKNILWFISGGSSVPVAIETAKMLEGLPEGLLRICIVDDFYLPADIREKNWRQLNDGGLSRLGHSVHSLLKPTGSVDDAVIASEKFINDCFMWKDFAIGQFGIGADFHTGGILPYSQAATETSAYVKSYSAADGVGKITITPRLIKNLDVAFINALGEEKRDVIAHFLTSSATVTKEPAQALKQAKKTILCSNVLPS